MFSSSYKNSLSAFKSSFQIPHQSFRTQTASLLTPAFGPPVLMFVAGEIWRIKPYQTVIFPKKSWKCRIHQQQTREAYSAFADKLTMCSRCLSNSNSSVRFEKKHCFALVVLNWIKAFSHDTTCIIRFFCTIMLKLKKWFMNHWIYKGVVYEPKQNSFSPHVKVLQTLARPFVKLIHWVLNKLSLNWIE